MDIEGYLEDMREDYLDAEWDRTVRSALIVSMSALSLFALAGCGREDSKDYRNSRKDLVEIEMVGKNGGFEFRPEKVYIDKEDKVRWISREGFHTSTPYNDGFPEDADFEGTEYLGEGEKSEIYDFEVEGEYDYYCIPHKDKGMRGKIVVGRPYTD